jgi:catechol 2,3-dioxygenase-like lactoylglutathione lyase family enzyme
MQWLAIALVLVATRMAGAQEVQPSGRIVGIGGIFFKSANRDQTRDWYAKHLGLADKGQGAMLPWRERDNPQKEHVTVWTVFPATTTYLGPAPLMINYIVDDMDSLLDRLKQEGVKIDPKRMDESYGRFAWIYDPDGNKIELWQPVSKPQSAESEVLALDEAWVKAEVGHDQKALERILDEALVVTYASGKTVGRKEFIEQIVSRPVPPFEVAHDSVHIHGDTAVVIDRFGEGLKNKATWVAVKKSGQWRVISEHFSTIREAN